MSLEEKNLNFYFSGKRQKLVSLKNIEGVIVCSNKSNSPK